LGSILERRRKMLRILKHCLLSIGLSLVISGLTTSAEEAITPTVKTDEIIVTASRYPEEVKNIPANVNVITSKDIKKSHATTVDELLKNIADINFRSYSGNVSQAEIDLRGFGENSFGKTLILLNGVRLNRPDMASINWLQIPISEIERIEVVRGSSSVLYGDNAVSGVINIITKPGEEKPSLNLSVVESSYNTYNRRVGFSGAKDKLSFSLRGENILTDGYRRRTGYESSSAGFDLGYIPIETLKMKLYFSLLESEYQMPGYLTKSQMEENRKQARNLNNDAKNKYQHVGFNIEKDLSQSGKMEFSFANGEKDIKSNMDSWFSWADLSLRTISLATKYIHNSSIPLGENRLLVGIDLGLEPATIKRFSDRTRKTQTLEADLEKNTTGLYVYDELSIGEKTNLTLGVRAENSQIKGNATDLGTGAILFDDSKKHRGLAYRGGVNHFITENVRVFTRYDRLYRYPFLDEQASYWGYGGDYFNKDIDAEKGNSCEIGANLFTSSDLSLGLTLFRTDMKDEIAYDAVTRRNENLDRTRHQGIELSYSLDLQKSVAVKGNYSLLDAKFASGQYEDNKIPLIPKQKYGINLEVLLVRSLSLAGSFNFTDKVFIGGDKANNQEKIASYSVVDLSVHYKPETKDKSSVFVGISNLFNKKYCTMGYMGRPHNGYYPAPERSLKAGLSLGF
jgi:iron complex outermembrane receptor protein